LYQFTYNDEIITSFSAQLAKLYGSKNGQVIEVSEEALNAHQQFHIEYAGKPGDFEILSYADVVNGTIPPAYFENRIVLIGPYTVGIKDDFLTPMDAKQSMYGVEIHANIIQNILEENYKNEIHWVMNLLIVVALAGTIYLAGRKLSPIVSFIVAIVFVILVFITSKLLYEAGWIISLIYPLLLIIAAYIATVAYNYLVELTERKRITSIFGKYVAPQVVSQILQDGEEGLKLGGSRKEVTVMFVDIRGFTPLSEGVEPEEIVGILNEYLELTSSCIFNHNGTLDKFIGDATMAMFNAPLPLENHELQAAKTALAMKEGSVELEKMLQERFGKSVKFGIGIHTGQAVVGNIGAKSRMDYTVIGDTVNTAARLESNAKPGQILLSEQVYEKIKDAIVANPLGEIMVKGKAHPIKIYELEGIV
jgi:adenylate cyclase